MITIERTSDFSELRPGPRARAEESVQVWRVQYGPPNSSADHTLIYFGIVATNALCAQGMAWAQPGPALFDAPLSVRKEAAKAWTQFSDLHPWTLFAFCDKHSKTNQRFLEFLGFAPYTTDNELAYYKGAF